ncbi:MAG: hypothetical protein AAF467_08305 [Actinomycetota bacterium]
MTDELDQLAGANPIDRHQLEAAVRLDQQELLQTLRADGQQIGARPYALHRRARPTARVGYVTAAGLVAAAFLAAVYLGSGVREADAPATDPAAAPAETAPDGEAAAAVPEPTLPVSATGEAVELPRPPAGGETAPKQPPPVTDPSPTTSPPAPRAGQFDPGVDLLSLHFDDKRDDGHAAVAGRAISDTLDLNPHVVGGTGVREIEVGLAAFPAVMDATWGPEWLDAEADWPGAVEATAARWRPVLEAGGEVWVAEAGQSDFTADVVRSIEATGPGIDTAAIHVVQHSSWNETNSTATDLAHVQAATSYVRIDDGNHANGTADLRMRSENFVGAALAGPWAEGWQAAFESLDPAVDLDFSDTVTLLHIIGVGPDRVADPDDFAELFLSPPAP